MSKLKIIVIGPEEVNIIPDTSGFYFEILSIIFYIISGWKNANFEYHIRHVR